MSAPSAATTMCLTGSDSGSSVPDCALITVTHNCQQNAHDDDIFQRRQKLASGRRRSDEVKRWQWQDRAGVGGLILKNNKKISKTF